MSHRIARVGLIAGLLMAMSLGSPLAIAQPEPRPDETRQANTSIELPPVLRVGGDNRAATAAQLARTTHPQGADTVVVVSADWGSDADPLLDGLVSGPLASALDAPVLLSNHDLLNSETRDELARLDPEAIVIVGPADARPGDSGPAGPSADVEAQRDQIAPVTRLGTSATAVTASAQVAHEAQDEGADGPVVIASAASWPNTFSAATLAGALGGVSCSLRMRSRPRRRTPEWDAVVGAADEVIIVGGTAAVAESVEHALDDTYPATVTRLAGPTREGTSAAAAEDVITRNELDGIDRVWIARRDNAADVISAAPAIATRGVVLLVQPTDRAADPASPAGELLLQQVLAGVGLCGDEAWCGQQYGEAAAGWIRSIAARPSSDGLPPLEGRVVGGTAAVPQANEQQLAFLLHTGHAVEPPPIPADCIALPAQPTERGQWQAEVTQAGPNACFSIPSGVHHGQEITPLDGQQFRGEPGAVMDGATQLTDSLFVAEEHSGQTVWRYSEPLDQTYDEPAHCSDTENFRGRTCRTQDVFELNGVGEQALRFLEHAGSPMDVTIDDALASVADDDTEFDGHYFLARSHPIDPRTAAATLYLLQDPATLAPLAISTTSIAFQGEQRSPAITTISDVVITDLEIRHYAPHFQRGAINGGFAEGWVLERIFAHHNHAVGVALGRSGLARDIHSIHNGQLGFAAAGLAANQVAEARIVLDGGTFANNNQLDVNPGFEGGAMKISGAVRGVDVRNQTLAGIFYEISHGPAVIAGNSVGPGGDRGIFLSTSNGVLVTGNTLLGCPAVGDWSPIIIDSGMRTGEHSDDYDLIGPLREGGIGALTRYAGEVDVRENTACLDGPGYGNRPGLSVEDGPDADGDDRADERRAPREARVHFEGNCYAGPATSDSSTAGRSRRPTRPTPTSSTSPAGRSWAWIAGERSTAAADPDSQISGRRGPASPPASGHPRPRPPARAPRHPPPAPRSSAARATPPPR